jgi:hypothetical protein
MGNGSSSVRLLVIHALGLRRALSLCAVAAALLAVPTGCWPLFEKDQCQTGQGASCVGSVARTCFPDGDGFPNEWGDEDCGTSRLCRVSADGGRAVCSLRPDPDPGCPPGEAEFGYCDGKTVVTCHSGYRVAEEPCAQNCFDSRATWIRGDPAAWNCTMAVCTDKTGPDPRCKADGPSIVCYLPESPLCFCGILWQTC